MITKKSLRTFFKTPSQFSSKTERYEGYETEKLERRFLYRVFDPRHCFRFMSLGVKFIKK